LFGRGGDFARLGDHALGGLIGRGGLPRKLLARGVGILDQRGDRAVEIARQRLAFGRDDGAVELGRIALHDIELEQSKPVDRARQPGLALRIARAGVDHEFDRQAQAFGDARHDRRERQLHAARHMRVLACDRRDILSRRIAIFCLGVAGAAFYVGV